MSLDLHEFICLLKAFREAPRPHMAPWRSVPVFVSSFTLCRGRMSFSPVVDIMHRQFLACYLLDVKPPDGRISSREPIERDYELP